MDIFSGIKFVGVSVVVVLAFWAWNEYDKLGDRLDAAMKNLQVSESNNDKLKNTDLHYIHRQTLKNSFRYTTKNLTSISEKIFYGSLKIIETKIKTDDGLAIFKKALDNVAPVLEVKSKRIGGATYQVPVKISKS